MALPELSILKTGDKRAIARALAAIETAANSEPLAALLDAARQIFAEKGVEAALNSMLNAKDMESVEAALNYMLETKEPEAPLEPVSPPRSIGAGSVCRSLGPRQ